MNVHQATFRHYFDTTTEEFNREIARLVGDGGIASEQDPHPYSASARVVVITLPWPHCSITLFHVRPKDERG